MSLVQDLIDRLSQLQSDRARYEKFWYDAASYVLPDAERFDAMFASGDTGTVRSVTDSVVGYPVAAERSRAIYDMTSLWAVDRGATGMLSLVTPATQTWHDVETDDPFGGEASDEEDRWYERYRDYLFRMRGNPMSGFWVAQKASMRCLWAFGTAVVYIEEAARGPAAPISYRYVPLSENHLGTNFEGVHDTNFRLFTRSARQCVERWGDACSSKTKEMAADEKKKDQLVSILHAVYPRDEKGSYGNTNRDSRFASCYVEVQNKHLIGDSGYYEFPFRVDHWQRNTAQPYSEGPVSIAIAEIKSLNMLSKEELRGTQQWLNPPLATHEEGMGRLNLNPRAVNPGYIGTDGRLLAQPIITVQRPDLARAILEARQNAVKETLYVNLWQILVDQRPGETATAALIRAQEKGDLLGPVGSSLQTGLSHQFDRETGILLRRGAFESGSPLAPPQSLNGRDIGVRFTSPLDKMRRLPQYQGMQELTAFAGALAQAGKVEALDKLNADEMMDEAADILGVPRKVIASDDTLAAMRQQRQMQEMTAAAIEGTRGAGEAGQEAAAAIDAVSNSPAAREVLGRVAERAGVPA